MRDTAGRPRRRGSASIMTLRAVDPDDQVDHDLVRRIARRTGVTEAAVLNVLSATLEEIPPQ